MSSLHLDLQPLLAGLLSDVVAAGRGFALLVRDADVLQAQASQGLPDTFIAKLRLPVSATGGANGAAAALGRPVVVQDTRVHPSTIGYSNLLSLHHLFSIVSWPILGPDGDVVATLALYGREPGVPTEEEVQALQHAAEAIRPRLA